MIESIYDRNKEYVSAQLIRRIIRAPRDIRKKMVGLGPADILVWQEDERAIYAFAGSTVSVTQTKRTLKRHGHPFPQILAPINVDKEALFNLAPGTTSASFAKLTFDVGNGYVLNSSGDSSASFIDVRVKWRNGVDVDSYVLPFLAIVTFGSIITPFSAAEAMEDCIASSVSFASSLES